MGQARARAVDKAVTGLLQQLKTQNRSDWMTESFTDDLYAGYSAQQHP